ncbi:MAG: hypothetical protein ACXV3F_10230 [Frankiaceae bacterium]
MLTQAQIRARPRDASDDVLDRQQRPELVGEPGADLPDENSLVTTAAPPCDTCSPCVSDTAFKVVDGVGVSPGA